MTIEDFRSKNMAVSEYYKRYLKNHGATLAEAANEPLKISALEAEERPVTLPTGKVVRPGEAMFYYCLEDLVGRYIRQRKATYDDIAYMASVMIKEHADWSVLDLCCFVQMVVLSRVPSMVGAVMEYQLLVVDVDNIMKKVASYESMRPNRKPKQAMITPTCREREWDPKKEHMLFDGTPHEFGSVEEAKRYWHNEVDYSNEGEKKHAKSIASKYQGVRKNVS